MRIRNSTDIEKGLLALAAKDPKIAKIIKSLDEPVPLRRKNPDFEGFCNIIVSQLLSKFSAEAIFSRLKERVLPLSAENFKNFSFEDLLGVGLSRNKYDTLLRIAVAVEKKQLDLAQLEQKPIAEAMKILTEIKGVGPWSAEVFLLLCVGHQDIFPAGDIALRYGVREGLELDQMPSEKEVRKIAERWSPWRGVAARVFWAYYSRASCI